MGTEIDLPFSLWKVIFHFYFTLRPRSAKVYKAWECHLGIYWAEALFKQKKQTPLKDMYIHIWQSEEYCFICGKFPAILFSIWQGYNYSCHGIHLDFYQGIELLLNETPFVTPPYPGWTKCLEIFWNICLPLSKRYRNNSSNCFHDTKLIQSLVTEIWNQIKRESMVSFLLTL